MIQLNVQASVGFSMNPSEWDSVGGLKAAITGVIRNAVQNYCGEHDVDYVAVEVSLPD